MWLDIGGMVSFQILMGKKRQRCVELAFFLKKCKKKKVGKYPSFIASGGKKSLATAIIMNSTAFLSHKHTHTHNDG